MNRRRLTTNLIGSCNPIGYADRMGARRHGFVFPGLLVVGVLILIGAGARGGATPGAEQTTPVPAHQHAREQSLEHVRAELTLAHLQLARLDAILQFAVRYEIGADVATDVYDIALAEGIEPELALRLIKAESGFAQRATARVQELLAAGRDPQNGYAAAILRGDP